MLSARQQPLLYPTQWDTVTATFIETNGFTESVVDLLPDPLYGRIQQLLMAAPASGDVMPVSAKEKKQLRLLAEELQREATAAYERRLKEND